MSSIESQPRLPWGNLMNNLAVNLSNWSDFMKGEIMNVVNGKLVQVNTNSLDEELKSIYQPEESQIEKIESLQISFENLSTRVDSLEINRLQRLQAKLELIEKRTAKQLITMAILGSLGLSGLGIWMGTQKNALTPVSNATSLSELTEK
ncbi:hypothetical protein [Merismopedia glauca]|uniref:Uncharacterized protein n=1 Tax=Merismopedia glauca CCAP 1448/3 TaxID=1296344 RepID=A0A2T1C1M6_9CYAN|nr:hypothetical protein [Merismopedia glauca]PSB02104.1 hypothetical protein C7B64_14860 [Merismopedia glauca CCAP 1448/3]